MTTATHTSSPSNDVVFNAAQHTLQAFANALVALAHDTNPRTYLGRKRAHMGGPSSAPSMGCKVGVLRPWELEARKAFAPLKGLIEQYHLSAHAETQGLAKLGINTPVQLVAFRREVKAHGNAHGEIILSMDGGCFYKGDIEGACGKMCDLLNGQVPSVR